MGTLGCINDMMRRDKENRGLRHRNRERMKETHSRLLDVRSGFGLPDMSAEDIEHIRKNTMEKEWSDSDKLFRMKVMFAVVAGALFLLCYAAYMLI